MIINMESPKNITNKNYKVEKNFKTRDRFLVGWIATLLHFSMGCYFYFIWYKDQEKTIFLSFAGFSTMFVFFLFAGLSLRKTYQDKNNPDCVRLTEDYIYIGKHFVTRKPIIIDRIDIVDIEPFFNTQGQVDGIFIFTRGKRYRLTEVEFLDINDFYSVADTLAGRTLSFKKRKIQL